MFTHSAMSVDDAVDLLRAQGMQIDGEVVRDRTVLDTFDGRLHAAGLRLSTQVGDTLDVVLESAGSVPATLSVPRVPRTIDDFPAGPMRARLAPIGIRALLPLISYTDRVITASRGDRLNRTIVEAAIHRPVRATPWTLHVHERPGHHKPALQLRESLHRYEFEQLDDSLIELIARGDGVDLRGYDSSPGVPLQRDSPAAEAFRDVFVNLATTANANWQGVIDDVDTEFLHELRVALRRTRSVLALGKGVLDEPFRQQYRERFAWLAGLTGPTRDLDVYLLEWSRHVAALAADSMANMQPVVEHMRVRRDRTQRELVAALESSAAAELIDTWLAALSLLGPDGDAPRARSPIGEIIARKLIRAHDTVIDNGRRISSLSPAEELHELRKDAKRLRYLVECFGGLVAAPTRKGFVKQLKGLQDNLGEHQDADVHAVELRSVADELHHAHASRQTLVAIGQLTQQLETAKVAARAEFADRFATFDSKGTRQVLNEILRELVP